METCPLRHRHGNMYNVEMDMETWPWALPNGEIETWRHEDMETWIHGDMNTQGHGDMETWKYGDTRHRHGDMDMETRELRHGHGDLDIETWTWRHGH